MYGDQFGEFVSGYRGLKGLIAQMGEKRKELQHMRSLALSLPECLMEFCKVTLTFESVDEIL